MRSGDALLRDLGMTGARWQVLGSIVDTPRTVAQIARLYELSRQGVLWIVQTLLKEGVVELIKNPDHKRAKLVKLTERGAQLYDEIAHRQHIWSNALGAKFSLEDIRVTTECLRRLGDLA